MIKKVLGFAASTLIVAGSVSAPTYAEDFLGRLSVRATGHFDQVSNSRSIYANRTAIVGQQGEFFFVEPDYEWDYSLGLEYMLPNSTESSLLFDYDHYGNNKNASITTTPAAAFNSIFGAIPLAVGQSTGELRLKDQTYRLGARKVIEVSNSFDLQVGAYAEHSKIHRGFTVNEGGVNYFNSEEESSGWGPSFDLYGHWYPMGRSHCLSLLGGIETAVLFGDSTYSATGYVGGLPVIDIDLSRNDLNQVFTRIAGTLAIAYNRSFIHDWNVGFKLGGRWLNYPNAFKGNGGSQPMTDYGRWGPFVEVRVGGVDAPL